MFLQEKITYSAIVFSTSSIDFGLPKPWLDPALGESSSLERSTGSGSFFFPVLLKGFLYRDGRSVCLVVLLRSGVALALTFPLADLVVTLAGRPMFAPGVFLSSECAPELSSAGVSSVRQRGQLNFGMKMEKKKRETAKYTTRD